jgi:hypothetical protein
VRVEELVRVEEPVKAVLIRSLVLLMGLQQEVMGWQLVESRSWPVRRRTRSKSL